MSEGKEKGAPHVLPGSNGSTKSAVERGIVYLVGAGPGDPGLLTARALELIETVDVILYDRLIPRGALDRARDGAELLFVGKEGGGPSVPQVETEDLIVERALLGLSVMRLKGGDPFVFGRGGEEALRLKEEGIPYEIVPGVTAGIAAPAHAGIPVTHRGLSTAVAFVTGHTKEDGEQGAAAERGAAAEQGGTAAAGDGAAEQASDIDWAALASFPGTLVFYMGVRRLKEIASSLVAAGRPERQPAAVIEKGTMPQQRVVYGRLDTIAKNAAFEGVKAPAITVVGDVVGLAPDLLWRGHAPLGGLSVAVTRARPQASVLAERLTSLGADVIEAPTIEIQPLPADVPDLSNYDLLCLTSPNGVEVLFERLSKSGRDARALSGLTIAAIGPGTSRALKDHGVRADVVPKRFVAEGLVEALEDVEVKRALIARAEEARPVLPDALRERGAKVDVLSLYKTAAAPLSSETLSRARKADYITFTSSSTVSFFLEATGAGGAGDGGAAAGDGGAAAGDGGAAAGGSEAATSDDAAARRETRGGEPLLAPKTRIVSIGPVTSDTLREHRLSPHVEAEKHDIDGLIDALLADVARR